jgi:hypothetical protein
MEKVSNCGGESLEKYVATTAINPISSNIDDFSGVDSQLTGDESYSNLFDGWKARREEKRAQKAEKKAAKIEIKKARAGKIAAKGEAAKKADAKLAGAQAEQSSASQEGAVAQAIAGAPAEDGNKKTMIIVGVSAAVLLLGGLAIFAMRKKAA